MEHLAWIQMLAKARGLEWQRLLKLAQVQTELGASFEEMLGLVEEVLHPDAYSREEICVALGITPEQFCTDLLSSNTQHGRSIARGLKDFTMLFPRLTFSMCSLPLFCLCLCSSHSLQAVPACQACVRGGLAGPALQECV